jgi:hypothetical protein
LIILQYNVRNERVRTMISLFVDKKIQDYDVIAIQKLWRNSFASISLSSSQNDFHLSYKSRNDIRICFYVNDQIDIESWKVEYSTIDLSVLKMIVKEVDEDTKIIRIHNVYNSSLILYTSKNNSFTLSKIMRFIDETLDDHHIFLKDFNLHHFFWSDSFRSTQHVATDDLLDIMQNRISHFDFIEKLDHVKSSQFNQHHRSHFHDDSFSEKIKTLHDTFWFRSIVESHSHFDKNSLRHEVESFANRTQNMKAH